MTELNCGHRLIELKCGFYGSDTFTTNAVPGLLFLYNSTFAKLAQKCNYKQKCLIYASDAFLFGPSKSISMGRNLYVQYKCVSKLANPVEPTCYNSNVRTICPYVSQLNMALFKQISASLSQDVVIECKENELIDIKCAFYGLDNSIFYTYFPTPNVCLYNKTFEIIASNCNNRTSCYFPLTESSQFQDPCISSSGNQKRLVIQYICVKQSKKCKSQ